MDIITLIVGIVVGYGLKSFLDKNKFSLTPKVQKTNLKPQIKIPKTKPVEIPQIKEVAF